MKTKIFAIALFLLAACSPDEFTGADPNGIPTVSGTEFQMTVDQETNQMVASYTPAQGTYPVWIIDGTSYSTLQEVGYTNTEAGTHSIELRIGNRNGISQTGISKTFTFNETKIDWSADFRRITGKDWRIDSKEVGHMGCGPAGTDATAWWSAAVNDKKDFGVYDDRITFTADTRKGGTYTYNAGADGLTYVNKGCTTWGTQNNDADVDVAIGNQTAAWNFETLDWADAEGIVTSGCKYIRLAANTAFPYISSDTQYESPLFRVEQLTNTKMVLLYETPDRSIAWRYVFTSAAEQRLVEETGFDASSDFNLWKGVAPSATFHFQPGWGDVRTGEMEAMFQSGNNDYTVTVPDACTDRWQAQLHLHTTDVSTSAANHYDFSCIFLADADIDGVTVKLTNETDADAIIDVADISLKAGQPYVFWKSDLEGKDLQPVKLVFDFGHAAGATTINISNIVLKDHANDDGTIVSGGQGGHEPAATADWDENSAANLWKAVEEGSAFEGTTTWFADNGWGTLPVQPEIAHSNGVWELDVPEGTGSSQWQGQVKIFTTIPASLSKKYNFYCVLEADNDIAGATIKLTESDYSESDKRDGNFFFDGRHDVKAGVPLVYKAEAAVLSKDDAHALTLVFDFGGAPAGTHIKVSKIFLEENVSMAYDDAANLWRSVDEGTAFIGTTTWFANDGWATLPVQPEIKHNGNSWELDVPEGIGNSQWQGQVKIFTTLSAAQTDAYNFQCTVVTDNDAPGVTIKLTESDYSESDKRDGNFYFDGRHDVKADEPFTYKATGVTLPQGDAHELTMVFDFGGTPAGTHVIIKDIIFEKAQ